MKIDLVASLPHYVDHMLPIWEALPDDMKGTVHPLRDPVDLLMKNRVAMVAGWQDVQPLRGRARMVYVEHGAGQTYTGDIKSAQLAGYAASGGARHIGVVGFISPNSKTANYWTTAPAAAVGCPKMDQYRSLPAPVEDAVCFAWHWDCFLSPETRSAFNEYLPVLKDAVEQFKDQGFRVYGHSHPRWAGMIDQAMSDHGLELLTSDREVFEKASVLFVDNSSIGMEFMSLGRPVVWINASTYRKDVDHGGRFWRWTEHSPVVDTPEQLATFNVWDVIHAETPELKAARQEIVDEVYTFTDGSSSQRAADFIVQLFEGQ